MNYAEHSVIVAGEGGKRHIIYLILQVRQESKGHSPEQEFSEVCSDICIEYHIPSSGIISHDKIDMLPIGNVVEEILFPDVCQFAIRFASAGCVAVESSSPLACYWAEFWIKSFEWLRGS